MVNAASIAQPFLHDIAAEAATLSAKLGRKPKLLGILANADEPSRLYAKSTCKACTEAGLDFELLTLGSEEEPAQPSDVEASIIQANLDDSVDGIMTYMPLFGPSEDAYLQQVCAPQKDIEGLHFFFRFLMYHNVRFIEPSLLEKGTPSLEAAKGQPNGLQADWPGLIKAILPCTSLAVVKVLEGCGVYNQVLEFGKRAFGKTITVINRSEVVGRPLAALLANDGARVFSADITGIVEFSRRKAPTDGSTTPAWQPNYITRNCKLALEDCLGQSDVVISGVPAPSYKVATAHLKDGVVAINFSSAKNFEADIKDKASLYIPSVGRVTTAMAMRNLLRLAAYRKLGAAAVST